MYNNRNFRQRHKREWKVVLKQINKPDEKVSRISTDIISLNT